MTDIDLTGWTPHNGGGQPQALNAYAMVVPLFRGKVGPQQGTETQSSELDWYHHPEPDAPPNAMDMILGKSAPLPAADIIAWKRPGAIAITYPHVRADMGL